MKRFNPPQFIKQIKRRIWPHRIWREWHQMITQDKAYWQAARRKALHGPRILIATSIGGNLRVLQVEALLAAALTLRGAQVHFLLCDKALSACAAVTTGSFHKIENFAGSNAIKKICADCFSVGSFFYHLFGLPVHRYSSFIDAQDRARAAEISQSIAEDGIKDFQFDGLDIGEHALSGALRFFAKSALTHEPFEEPILRKYLEASITTAHMLKRLYQQIPFQAACFHHGIYVPQGLIGEVSRHENVRVINWCTTYRKHCFIFSHNDTYHHTLMSEPMSHWENMSFGPKQEREIIAYLDSRRLGTHDWIRFHDIGIEDMDQISLELGIDFSKPTIGLLTNVLWDAQLHYPSNIFPSMLEWLIETIRYVSRRPDIQLVIRIHPAELNGEIPSRQLAVHEIQKAFPRLAHNIFVIPPESRISTYTVMSRCDSILIYGTKTGVELTSMGLPVIVAGEAWIRGKGLTLDASSQEEYFKILDRLPLKSRMGSEEMTRARKFAYHFFFRRMIPLPVDDRHPVDKCYQTPIKSLRELEPGRHLGLDLASDGIMNGHEFIYPAETFDHSLL